MLRQQQHRVERGLAEGFPLRRALDLHEAPVGGHHHIHVHRGVLVHLVVQIQHGLAVEDAHADRGHGLLEHGAGIDGFPLLQPLDGQGQRHIAAGDGGGARAAVGLEHVAVHQNLPLAQLVHIHRGAEAASHQALDFLGAPFGLQGLALVALFRGPGQHGILGRDPALFGLVGDVGGVEPAGDVFFHGGVAEHPGVAHADEHGAFRVDNIVKFQLHGAELVQRAGDSQVCTSFLHKRKTLPVRKGLEWTLRDLNP